MIRTIICVLFTLLSLNAVSQTTDENLLKEDFDPVSQEKKYRIEIFQNQFIELTKFKNGNFSGKLVNSVWKNKGKKYRIDLISQKIKIPDSMSKKLMLDLERKGIEQIPKCTETKDCITTGVDGRSTNIFVFGNDLERSYSYWEVESEHYYKKGNVPNEIQQIRELLLSLENETHYRQQFKRFLDYLPKGSYSYGGINMIKL